VNQISAVVKELNTTYFNRRNVSVY